MNRRQKTTEETRQNIISAARKLFSERGYAQSRVEDIAVLAGVAAVTIYTSTGGKSGILQALVESCGEFQVQNGFSERLACATEAGPLLEDTARTLCLVRQEFADVIYAMQDAAPYDKLVAEMLREATKRYRGVCGEIALRLESLGALRTDITRTKAADLIWFHFGWWSWFTLHNENGWSYSEAQQWLLESLRHSILEDRSL